ncbi:MULTISPECIES: tetratricopeptide repeat protein [unclassified Haematospirillum]|uniref:tetratricopeptide repeat protein n=1 Tax=unclassified Haematospirillum TaxID=2622088 RepID=UPI001439D0F0|nr:MULTISPECIES: tetratricopeptide repeat protein [unclassified Haematospirillum]NKD55799.1 tetratricopeptide repeat protein [Haematospirillum sp. H4890]NKD75890.1 tetratricopeptide repeat protein [Haematospirillum sp. H4485]
MLSYKICGRWPRRRSLSRALPRAATLWVSGAALLLASCGPVSEYGSVSLASELQDHPPPLSSAFGQYLAGRQAQVEHDSTAAATYYQSALLRDSANIELARRTWYYMLVSGQSKNAIALAAATLPHDKGNTLAPLVVATGAAHEGRWHDALEILAPLKTQGLNSFVVPLMRAWILAGSGQHDQALETLRPMRQQQQLVPLHDFHAGLILDTAGRDAEAGYWYEKVLDGSSLSLRAAQIIAAYLHRNSKTEAALELFERYRREHMSSVLVDAALMEFRSSNGQDRPVRSASDGLSEALYGTASSIVQEKAWDAVLVFSRMALIARPDFSYAQLMIGDVLYEQRRWKEAAHILGSITKDTPLFWPARLKMAEAFEQDGLPDKARNVLNTLSDMHPETPEPLMLLGDLERRQNRWSAAISAYRSGLERLKGTTIPTWPAHYSLGMALERNGQWNEAEKHLLLALEQQPDHPMILNYLGYSWIDRGLNLERGKAMIEQAVAQRPDDGFIVDSLGWALYLLGDYQGAITYLEQAVELEPADPTINDHLGDAYWKAGRTREAIFQWKRALSLKPEDSIARSITQKLDEHAKGREGTSPQ